LCRRKAVPCGTGHSGKGKRSLEENPRKRRSHYFGGEEAVRGALGRAEVQKRGGNGKKKRNGKDSHGSTIGGTKNKKGWHKKARGILKKKGA